MATVSYNDTYYMQQNMQNMHQHDLNNMANYSLLWNTGTSTTASSDTCLMQSLQDSYMRSLQESRVLGKAKKMLRFFRVNKIVEVEGSPYRLNDIKFEDPIDELRVKVQRWLNPRLELEGNYVG